MTPHPFTPANRWHLLTVLEPAVTVNPVSLQIAYTFKRAISHISHHTHSTSGHDPQEDDAVSNHYLCALSLMIVSPHECLGRLWACDHCPYSYEHPRTHVL